MSAEWRLYPSNVVRRAPRNRQPTTSLTQYVHIGQIVLDETMLEWGMVKILRLTLIAVVSFAAAVVVARVVGAGQSTFLATLFTYPDGSACPHPCLLGIHPESTELESAVTLLKQHPASRQLPLVLHIEGRRVAFSDQWMTYNVVADDNGRVKFISLTIESEDKTAQYITLGQAVAVLGEPPRFQSIGIINEGIAWLYYTDKGLALQTRRVGSEHFGVDDELIGLFVSKNLRTSLSPQLWKGFGSVERYQAELLRTQQ